MNECDYLIQQLHNIADRPGMYGSPEIAELAAINVAHVLFHVVDPDWDWSQTQRTWKDIALQLGTSHRLTSVQYESTEHRAEKWGEEEHIASDKIQQIYSKIWKILNINCSIYPSVGQRVTFLLSNLHYLGSPDSIDIVLYCMMRVASPSCNDYFDKLYKDECVALRHTSKYGLRNLYAKSGHSYLAISSTLSDSEYTRLSTGIEYVLAKIREVPTLQK